MYISCQKVIFLIFYVYCLFLGYRAPIETYMELGRFASDEQLHPLPPEYPVNLCVGKEWYRFPSSFFLPEK